MRIAMRKRPALFLALILAGMALPAAAQTAVVYDFNGSRLLRIDPSGPTITTLPRPYFGRGHCFSHDGGLYMGVWSPGAPAWLARLDLTTRAVTTVARGSSATHFGAPYVPCLDAEARDGPGVWVFDGTSTQTSTIHVIRKPKACRVDVTSGTITWDNIVPTPWVPMADAYPDPHQADRVLAVGFWFYNNQIGLHTIYGAPTEASPKVVSTLDHPCAYDAFLHEDRRVYCWTNFTPTPKIPWFPQFVGLHAMDAKTGVKQSIPLSLPATNNDPWAAVWNEPWEKPGRIAYIACDADDTLYKVDLLASPPAAVSVTKLPAGLYIHGREVEEAQLASWRKGPTGRVFHLNFGAALGGKSYLLAPSLAGYAGAPVLLPGSGLELWMQPDGFTAIAALGLLPYPAWGILDGTGQRSVTFDVGVRIGLDFVWTALVVDQGKVLDVSNLILVSM
jgi:hypothetical protein